MSYLRAGLLACALLQGFWSMGWARDGSGTPAATQRYEQFKPVVTRLSGVFGGARVDFAATVSETLIPGPGGKPIAAIVSTAYVRDARAVNRPVVFAFNGGPGAASALLHVGALGPQRVVFPTDLHVTDVSVRPQPLISNEHSLLDVADLVFIDPPQTGYSRALPADRNREYASFFGDARLVAAFIRDWLRSNHREDAPKFILGESYGATRAAVVAHQLSVGHAGRAAVLLNGIILVSQMLTLDDLGPRPMNAGWFAASLPTMTAVAWHQGRIAAASKTFDSLLARSRRFAIEEYLPALMRGSDLEGPERTRLAQELGRLTGLTPATFEDHDLKVTTDQYRKLLLPGKVLGNYDGRYTASSADVDEHTDIAQRSLIPIIDAGIQAHLRDNLKVATSRQYVVLNDKVNAMWSFGDRRRKPASSFLTEVIARNPSIHVFAASGYDDFATPFATAEFLVAQLELESRAKSFKGYVGGHMFYTHEESLRQFAADLRRFIRQALAQVQ